VRARLAALLCLTTVAAGCGNKASPNVGEAASRIRAQPSGRAGACTLGQHELRIAAGRRALLRVTRPGRSKQRALLVALHGAGSGGAPGGLWAFRGAWEVPGLAIVAPAAKGTTWTLGEDDVRFVERALEAALARCPVDRRRVAIGGFSAGAGMALWLGLSNGDLFRGVIALSGGATLPEDRRGRPRVFIAHGTLDDVIPIELGGDRSAAELRREGYRVTYRRFRGGHRVLPPIAREAVLTALVR
jgi:predicted esterase